MSHDKTDLIYDALINFREECREEFKEIKQNAKAHSEEMHNHKEATSEEFKEVRKRLEKVEAPGKAFNLLGKLALWVVAIGAALGHLKGMKW